MFNDLRTGHIDEQELLSEISGYLAEYMLPERIYTVNSIPLSANGKVDRDALPVPDYSAAAEEAAGDLPVTALQKTIAEAVEKILNISGSHGFNMSSLHSRPVAGPLWHHYFFAELEGCVSGENGQDLLRQLDTVCDRLKMVGSYHSLKI